MANTDKDIVIRPRKGDASLNPVIEFVGADSGTGPQTITATVTPANQGTVTFSGTSGTILTIADNATDKLNVNGNVTVGGNLTVSGTTTTINTETINLADNIIVLNSNEAGTPSQNAGIEIERGTSTNVVLQWNETSDHWEIASGGTTGRILTTGDEGTGNGLDADTVDSIQGSSLLRSDASDSYTSGTLTFNSGTTLTAASGATVNFNNTTGTAPFTVASTTTVTNLHAAVADAVALVATNTTNATHYITFVDTATGDEAVRTDTGLTYNPSTGEVSAVDFNSTSDQALKENIVTIEDASGKVAQLRGVNFDWRENGKPAMGVIAQEVEAVIPEVVSSNGEHKTVNYGSIVGVLIEAIKDLQNKVSELENKIKE